MTKDKNILEKTKEGIVTLGEKGGSAVKDFFDGDESDTTKKHAKKTNKKSTKKAKR